MGFAHGPMLRCQSCVAIGDGAGGVDSAFFGVGYGGEGGGEGWWRGAL